MKPFSVVLLALAVGAFAVEARGAGGKVGASSNDEIRAAAFRRAHEEEVSATRPLFEQERVEVDAVRKNRRKSAAAKKDEMAAIHKSYLNKRNAERLRIKRELRKVLLSTARER